LSGDDPEVVQYNWGLLLESQNVSGRNPVIPRLCHGAAMLEASAAAETEADAVYTHATGQIIGVTMADCLAALVADPETGCVAAVHAGWRGSRDNILGRALARLFAEKRCRPESTHVALGPCLSPAALEIGEDVARTLSGAHLVRIGGKPHFDLRGCNRAQVIAAGVPPENISGTSDCTRGNPALYFSHRRDNGKTGRMAACILLS
jgi:YfiH family protein